MPFFQDYEFDPNLMFLLGVIIMIGVLMRRYMMRYRRRARQHAAYDTTHTERLLKKSTILDAPAEVLKWQVEMHETARDLKAELDSKMRALQALMVQAHEQEVRLADLLRRAHPSASAASPLADHVRRTIFELADRGMGTRDIASQVGLTAGDIEFALRLRRIGEE